MNIPSTYSPRRVTPRPNDASKSLNKAKAVIEGQRRALKNLR